MTADARLRLRHLIARRSLLRGSAIRLASGATTSFYFDMKRTVFEPEAANLVGALLLEAIGATPCDYVGGLEMGAVPVVSCVVLRSYELRPHAPIQGFFVRKQAKEHGTRRLIEGLPEDSELRGRRVVVLEDVTTTGGSALKAVEAARAEGALVELVVTIVDRLEGAEASLAAHGLRLVPILTARDFAL